MAQYCGAVLRRSLRTATKSLWSPVDQGALTTSTPQYSHSRVVLQLEAADGTGEVEDDSKADAPSAQMCVCAALQHPQRFRAGRQADLTA